MPDALFAHPRLAAVYDAFDGQRDDLPAYVAIAAELGARRILDVGCGTGVFAMLLADRGHEVTGVDPAAASLRVARARPGADRVSWIEGDAAAAPPAAADAAFMTGNVAQVFLTDDDWTGALRDVRAALRPHGHLVFEARRPERRAWREWTPGVTTRDVPGVGRVQRRFELQDVALPLVGFRYVYRFAADGTELTSDSTLRFRDAAEIEADLLAAGYRVRELRDAPDRPGREHVFLAQRTD